MVVDAFPHLLNFSPKSQTPSSATIFTSSCQSPAEPRRNFSYEMRPGEVSRGGFTYSYGNFQNKDGVHRLQGAHLEWIFLPRLTPKANELIRENRNFVRGQLQHYGVAYHETQFIGNGLQLLKKVLKAGMVRSIFSPTMAAIADMYRPVRQSAKSHSQTETPDAPRVAGESVCGGAFGLFKVDHGEVLR